MEVEEIFPWMKDVTWRFAKSFMKDYDSDTLSLLHGNIDKEIKVIYSSDHSIVNRAEVLYKEITRLYLHMRLKISQHSDFQNATLSCVKLMSQLIKVGLVLTQGLINSEWIERILIAIKLFPGKKVLVYDVLLLVNGLKKIHHKPYSAILKCVLTEDHHEYITDPLVYMEVILLFRRLKALELDRHKEHYIILITRIKPPSNLISWLTSLDVNGFSSFLKNLQYKKIALQLMKKNLPESFIKKIRCMALNPYKSETSAILNKNVPDCAAYVYDVQGSSTSQQLDEVAINEKDLESIYINESVTDTGHKYFPNFNEHIREYNKKQKSKSNHKLVKRSNLKTSAILNKDVPDVLFYDVECGSTSQQLDKDIINEENLEPISVNKISNIDINESGVGSSHKYFTNSNENITISKKKRTKSKHNLVKNSKSVTSASLVKHIPDNDVFFYDVKSSNTSQQLDRVILNKENRESGSGNTDTSYKHLPNSNVHTTESKKKRKLKSKRNSLKQTESKASIILSQKSSDNTLFFYDVEGNKNSSKKLETVHNVSSCSISPKRRFSEDTDNSSKATNVLKTKKKRLKSSKKNETKLCNSYVSFDDKVNSSVVSHQPLVSESSENKEENPSKDDDDVILITEKVLKKKSRKRLKSFRKNVITISECISIDTEPNSSNASHQHLVSENTEDKQKNPLKDDGDITLIAEKTLKKKTSKKPKSSKNNEIVISDNSVSSDDEKNPSVASHQLLISENKEHEQENSLEKDEDVTLIAEISKKKRKKSSSKDNSAKCVYFKKLMLMKVSDDAETSLKVSNERKNSKLLDMEDKDKNVNEDILHEYSLDFIQDQSAHLKDDKDKSSGEEEKVICDMPSSYHDATDVDKFSNSACMKNIDNLLVKEEEKCMIVHTSEETELVIKPKESSELPTLKSTIETTKESVENLNLELEKEENSVKNKESLVSLHINNSDITSVCKVKSKHIENKNDLKRSKENKSDDISNEESRLAHECSNMEGVPENEIISSQNLNVQDVENNTHEMNNHNSIYNIPEPSGLSNVTDSSSNQSQQFSKQYEDKCIGTDITSINLSSSENSEDNIGQDFDNSITVKNLFSTTVKELSVKASLTTVISETCLMGKNQENISTLPGNVLSHSASLEFMKSKDKSLLDDIGNVVNPDCITENSYLESKSELSEISAENSASNEFSNSDSIIAENKIIQKDTFSSDTMSQESTLCSKEQQCEDLQNVLCNENDIQLVNKKQNDINTDGTKNYEDEIECTKISQIQAKQQHICFDKDEKVEESCMSIEDGCKSSRQLNNVSKDLVNEKSTLPTKDNLSNDMPTSSEILDSQIKHKSLCVKDATQIIEENDVLKDIENEIEESKDEILNVQSELQNKNSFYNENVGQKIENSFAHEDSNNVDESQHNRNCDILLSATNYSVKSPSSMVLKIEELNNQSSETAVCDKEEINEKSPELEDVENKNQTCEKRVEIETTLKTLHPAENKEIIVNIETNSSHSDISLVNQEKNSERKDALDKVNNEIIENSSLFHNPSRESIEKSPTDKHKGSGQFEDFWTNLVPEDSQDIIRDQNNDRNISCENILSSNESTCLDSVRNSISDVKRVSNEKGNAFEKLKVVNSQDGVVIDDGNVRKNLTSESLLSSKESSSSDNISHLDLATEEKDTLKLPLESEKVIDACKNSDQFKTVHSEKDIIISKESISDESSSSNKSASLDINLITDLKHSVKTKANTLQFFPESKNVVQAPLSNAENPSFMEKTVDISHSTESDIDEFEKSPEKNSACDSEFQGRFIVLDESNSDVEDSKSNYSEHLIINSPPVMKLQNVKHQLSPEKAAATANDLKIKAEISPKTSCKQLHDSDKNQIEPMLTKDTTEISFKNCANKTDSEVLENASIKNSSLIRTDNSTESILSNCKKDLLMLADDCERSLEECSSKEENISNTSIVEKIHSSSLLKTESSKQLELKCSKINVENVIKNSSEVSEPTFIPTFCGNNKYASFSEISLKNKDKNINVDSVGPVPINNFSSAASTELFSMYRNELMHDEDKTNASLSSKDGVLSNSQETDEIKSQTLSNHSDEDVESRYSSQEDDDEGNSMDTVIHRENSNIHSNNIDESVSAHTSVISSAKIENDLLDDRNCSEDKSTSDTSVSNTIDGTHKKSSVKNTVPRQSLRLKNKTETKCETNSSEDAASDILNAQEASKRELKIILNDCKSNENHLNNSCTPVEKTFSPSLIHNNNEDSASSSQLTLIKENLPAVEDKEENSSLNCKAFDKKYSLRRRKSNRSRDDSSNLGIDLNKLKFDTPSSKSTRTRRESKFVKLLTSDEKLQSNPSDLMSVKREACSSNTKADMETVSNTSSYNLRNRKSLIAPAKLKI